ncbi:MAG: NapC/NirT family cytochrome c [Steroidobacteraceae bacterium]
MSTPEGPSKLPGSGWRRLVSGKWRLPSLIVGTLLFGAGILAVSAFSVTLAWTNTESFCISCHEMEAFVYEEFLDTVHDRNSGGVRATCIDCHVPVEFGPKLLKKIIASKDVYHHLIGTLDTREKFQARRLHMAETVWSYMKATDSRECRGCHVAEKMDFDAQNGRAARKHEQMATSGKTCIDCHKGVAHALPDDYIDDSA